MKEPLVTLTFALAVSLAAVATNTVVATILYCMARDGLVTLPGLYLIGSLIASIVVSGGCIKYGLSHHWIANDWDTSAQMH